MTTTVLSERELGEFFLGKRAAAGLGDGTSGDADRHSGVTRYAISSSEGTFDVLPAHLARTCRAYLRGLLTAAQLQAIGFALLASDYFEWDGDTRSGALVSEVASDWSTPEINRPINEQNVRYWLELLES